MGANRIPLKWPISYSRPRYYLAYFLFSRIFLREDVGVSDIYPGPEGKGKFVATCWWGSWHYQRSTCLKIVSLPKKGGEKVAQDIFTFIGVICSCTSHAAYTFLCRKLFANLTLNHPYRADRKRSSTCQTRFTNVQYTQRACSCAAMQPLLYVMCPISRSKTLPWAALTCHAINRTVVSLKIMGICVWTWGWHTFEIHLKRQTQVKCLRVSDLKVKMSFICKFVLIS